MVLCENRPEGFGPQSRFSSNLPTTCFMDVIGVPLATWIYLAVLVVIIIPVMIVSKGSTNADAATASDKSGVHAITKTRSVFNKIFKTIYYALIVAMLAMVSLEIARLSVADLGIGLLPFTYVGILTAVVLHLSTERRFSRSKMGSAGFSRTGHWRWAVKSINGVLWALLLCTMAIKVAAEAKEQVVAGHRVGQQAQYPLSDSITDNSTMVGVEFVLLILEFVTI